MKEERVMANPQEVQVQEKRELEKKKKEGTVPGRVFVAVADIFETDQALTVVLEIPGANKESVDVRAENDMLSVEGRVDFSNYAGLQPVYTEYNIGNYARSFQLSSKLNRAQLGPS
jgi:HSP20 family protein